ncbi:MAG: tripartite tricarboxylate transporter substrate binding protein [Betaproteobacteria bacterium]|nr:tripartite tricarboxylate transporter substrate binding protein [Betaproteobacteria bacterium]
MSSRFIQAVLTMGMLASCVTSVCAQDAKSYPNRPIRLVVPYAPGGTTDYAARLLSAKLADTLGQTVVVDNRPGAGSIIGSDLVAKANPDGYTLLMVDTGFSVTPALYAKLPFDAGKDFMPVTEAMRVSNWLIVPASLAARSVNDLVALAKAKPRTLTFGSGGVGSPFHMAGEQFKIAAKIDIVHVPYKGGGPALTDLIGGHISMLFPTMTIALPHVNAGRLRALAVIAPKRSAAQPDVPTMAESGYAGVTMTSWYGVMAPSGVPRPLVEKLAGEISKVLALPDVKERLATQFAEPVGSTPAAFGKLVTAEIATWTAVAKAGGIKAE